MIIAVTINSIDRHNKGLSMSGLPRLNLTCIKIGLLLAALSPTAWAESLLDVYQAAVVSDPTLAQAAANRLADQEAEPQAKALQLPELNASGSVEQTFLDNEPNFSDSSIRTKNANVTVTQSLYNRSNQVQIRRAEFVVDRAEADYLDAQQDLILRVTQSYFDVLARRDDLSFRTADKNAIARQLEQAKRRFEVGLITITDVEEAQAQYDLAVSFEIRAVNDLAASKEALREITGEFYNRLHLLSDRITLSLPDPPDLDAWVQQALKNNPVLLSAAYNVERAREDVNLQRANRYPTLNLTGSVSETDSTSSGFIRDSTIGLRLNVPIYEGGAKSSRVREAAYRYEAAKEFLEIQQRNIVRNVRDAYRGVELSISQITALDQARKSNRSALEATEAGFEVGTRTIVDVLNAQRNLFGAERDYSQARYGYIVSDLGLKRAAGLISMEDIERINAWLDPP